MEHLGLDVGGGGGGGATHRNIQEHRLSIATCTTDCVIEPGYKVKAPGVFP